MKKISKNSLTAAIAISLTLVFALPMAAFAATTPSLGAAASYGVLSSTYTDTSAATTVNGDVGFTTPPGTAIGGTHNFFGSGAPYSSAGTDQGSALSTGLNNQACDFVFGSDTDLSLLSQPLAPGVYCVTGAQSIGTGGITLTSTGTYIFRSTGALNTAANSHITLGGASACNIFWTPGALTTLGANSSFEGTDIDDSGITVGSTVAWTGRALSFATTVTTDADTITVPVCGPAAATINVVKTVVNDNGQSKVVADFPLFVNGALVVSGATNTFPAGTYAITETNNAHYVQAFSGDCDSSGNVTIAPGDNKFCIITNDDVTVPPTGSGGSSAPLVPPLIDVVKVPSPLSLPAGPGPVMYTYTLRNIGTVPVTNITMVGDTCSPIALISGDPNGDFKLDLAETWIYTCSTTLSATHTNTVTATGWANGISAVDIASATVVVGVPVIPPLIHVTKVPTPLALLAGGGLVTYTQQVTNPGTVPLNNVTLTDNKCGPVNYISGDVNGDARLDSNETWTYVCQTSLIQTTTNTVTATGQANGLVARDFAIATVVVAAIVPGLPNTGTPPSGISTLPTMTLLIGLALAVLTSLVILRKRKS